MVVWPVESNFYDNYQPKFRVSLCEGGECLLNLLEPEPVLQRKNRAHDSTHSALPKEPSNDPHQPDNELALLSRKFRLLRTLFLIKILIRCF